MSFVRTLTDEDGDYWWNCELKVWADRTDWEATSGIYTNHAPCRSLRSYRRMLKKYPFLVGNSVLVGKYIGHNIYGQSLNIII